MENKVKMVSYDMVKWSVFWSSLAVAALAAEQVLRMT